MNRRLLPQRLLIFVALFAVTTSLLACGGGRRFRRSTGFIQVANAATSNSAIEDVHILGNTDSYFFNEFIAPGDSDAFQVLTGNYDVEVFWLFGGSDTYTNIDVFFDSTSFLNVSF